ncbi:hypothetical protein MKW94_000359 [Papaver nudicaule]|uniref:TF-B3 domain-containing protein n=1 Tax=Papaver nudicaule TaxID=74823 RepID=A0AA41VFT6_PAPNU|nr:hypothetical protein [Papaver nudicaule]
MIKSYGFYSSFCIWVWGCCHVEGRYPVFTQLPRVYVMAEDSSTNNKHYFSSSSLSCSSSLSSTCTNVVDVVHHRQQLQRQQVHQLSSSLLSGNIDCSAGKAIQEFIQTEYMFKKVVTPSDVGKLSRLVIPKKYAETYFPLDSTANEKGGVLLNFEDRNGKPWRFKYCYWNKSQSYVMTKGWIQFVKEKNLNAGDVISFGRGATEPYKDRFYIDWSCRRRPNSSDLSLHHPSSDPFSNIPRTVIPWGTTNHAVTSRLLPSSSTASCGNRSNIIVGDNNHGPQPDVYLTSVPSQPINTRMSDEQAHRQHVGLMQHYLGGDSHNNMVTILDSVPVINGRAAAKRVRLFGVSV